MIIIEKGKRREEDKEKDEREGIAGTEAQRYVESRCAFASARDLRRQIQHAARILGGPRPGPL